MLFRACREVVVAGCNFDAGGGHAFCVVAHIADDGGQARLHGGQRLQQLAGFVIAAGFDGVGQVAIGNALCRLLAPLHKLHDGACDGEGQ